MLSRSPVPVPQGYSLLISEMTTLPSFVELMASLGLEQNNKAASSTPSPYPSPQHSPQLRISAEIPPLSSRSSSSSLKDTCSLRSRARYSPYSPKISAARRGSLSSLPSTSPVSEMVSLRACSTSPRLPLSPHTCERSDPSLSINIYGSTNDLSANTPISVFVRRKTPGTSPTSPLFPSETLHPAAEFPAPLSLPTLPTLFPLSSDSDMFPLTPDSDSHTAIGDVLEAPVTRRSRRHKGTRISTPPHSAELSDLGRRHVVHVQ